MDKEHPATIVQRRLRKTRQTRHARASTRYSHTPVFYRHKKLQGYFRGVMLEQPTELVVGTQSLPIDRPRSRLPMQYPVSKYVLYNIAPRSCLCMCFGSETANVRIPPRFFSLFEFCRHIAASHSARPPPFNTHMRRAVPRIAGSA